MATARANHEPASASQTVECACSRVRRASRAITQLYDAVLAPSKMKSTQFIILRVIAQHGSIAQWKLAQEHVVAVETLSRRLAGLRQKGLVELQISGARGEHIYRLTPAGQNALQTAMPYWERAQARLQQVLGQDQWDTLLSCTERLATAAREAAMLKTANRLNTAAPGSRER